MRGRKGKRKGSRMRRKRSGKDRMCGICLHHNRMKRKEGKEREEGEREGKGQCIWDLLANNRSRRKGKGKGKRRR